MRKFLLLTGVVLTAFTALPAVAQTTGVPAAAQATSSQANSKNSVTSPDNNEIVVTGTRTLGRTRLDNRPGRRAPGQ